MGLIFIDNRVETIALRDGAPTTGAISNMHITGSGVKFSEVMDVGTFKELILFVNVTTFTSGTLDCILQLSPDGKTFSDVSTDKITQVTSLATGYQWVKITSNFGKYIRFKFTFGSSPDMYANAYLVCKG